MICVWPPFVSIRRLLPCSMRLDDGELVKFWDVPALNYTRRTYGKTLAAYHLTRSLLVNKNDIKILPCNNLFIIYFEQKKNTIKHKFYDNGNFLLVEHHKARLSFGKKSEKSASELQFNFPRLGYVMECTRFDWISVLDRGDLIG